MQCVNCCVPFPYTFPGEVQTVKRPDSDHSLDRCTHIASLLAVDQTNPLPTHSQSLPEKKQTNQIISISVYFLVAISINSPISCIHNSQTYHKRTLNGDIMKTFQAKTGKVTPGNNTH